MRLLIIGNLDGHMTEAAQIAIGRGVKVDCTNDIDTALTQLRQGRGADMAFVDISLEIARLSSKLDGERIHLPLIACGIEGTSPKAAAKSIEDGALDYISLPPDPEVISALIETVSKHEDTDIICDDPLIKQVISLSDRIAPSDASVLITGSSGTGKEVFARYIHRKSKRANGPFVALNCAAIPENLLESELFGHEKGAFSGAVARRIGKFEESSGGTLLLDEISEMEFRLQAKLLRALQEKEINRVGSNTSIKVDVRILATSNRNMEKIVGEGLFREDLYFRLNVVNLQLPDLKMRPKDIILLADHFINKYSKSNGLPSKKFTKEAIEALMAHSWPGNVRELENTMHRAVLLARGNKIDESSIILGQPITKKEDNADFKIRSLTDVERDHILETLSYCSGNRDNTAHLLGMNINALRSRLDNYKSQGYEISSAVS